MLKLFALAVTLNYLQIVIGSSPTYNPESEKAQKVEYCKTLLDLQPKLPQRVQKYYVNIQKTLCPDDSVKIYDIFTYIKESLTANDNIEVHVIENGKQNYCEYILGISPLYRTDGSTEDSDKVKTPEYLQFKKNCKDSSKDITSIIPLAQKLAKIYHNF